MILQFIIGLLLLLLFKQPDGFVHVFGVIFSIGLFIGLVAGISSGNWQPFVVYLSGLVSLPFLYLLATGNWEELFYLLAALFVVLVVIPFLILAACYFVFLGLVTLATALLNKIENRKKSGSADG